LNTTAKKPYQATPQAARYDLFANTEVTILPGEQKFISTGIGFQTPEGYYGRIAPRSGLSLRNKIDIAAGVIAL